MKKGVIIALAICLVVGLFAGVAMPKESVVVASAEGVDKSSIVVSGKGEIKVKPDVAYINIGVETFDVDANKAQQDNANQMTKIMDALKKLGITDKEIKTTQYNIYKTYKPVNTKMGMPNVDMDNRVEGYNCNNMLEVTINDITATGKVIDAASKAGANNVYNIRFGIKDNEKYYAEALKKAVGDAKNKANSIASAVGVTVDKPFKVVENSGGYSPYIYRDAMMKAETASYGNYSTPVEAGELTISANVSVEYQY